MTGKKHYSIFSLPIGKILILIFFSFTPLMSFADCGDGTVDEGETCDDGNTDAGDGCDVSCNEEETCEESSADSGFSNLNSGTRCGAPRCGNGIVDPGEECDDENFDDTDGCGHDCKFPPPICGNRVVEKWEDCDDGNFDETDYCDNNCHEVWHSRCGDGVVQTRDGEECDDGNVINDDGCDNDCLPSLPECGNYIIEDDEDCDEGYLGNEFCTGLCTRRGTICGNGYVYGYVNATTDLEQCDDGNTDDGDGCSSTCQIEDNFNPCITMNCNDNNDCTDDSCDGGDCVNIENDSCDSCAGITCDDSDTCTDDSCDAGSCVYENNGSCD